MAGPSVNRRSLVISEATVLTSAMRKSARWVHSSIAAILGTQPVDESAEPLTARLGLRQGARANPAGPGELDLVAGLSRLSADIAQVPDFDQYSADVLLKPFLDVIQAPTTSGTLTLSALISVDKMLALGVINESSPDIGLALFHTAFAVTHSRFEASDQAENDAVLLQLILVMQRLVTGPLGHLLCDDAIFEVVETCLSMADHMRRADVLRRSAVAALVNMLRSIFSNLPNVPSAEDEDEREITQEAVQATAGGIPKSDADDEADEDENSSNTREEKPQQPHDQEDERNISTKPYGVAAIRRVFRILVLVLDPASSNTDSMRIIVLHLMNACFETAGSFMANHPSFVDITAVQLFKFLAQLVRKNHVRLVSEALKLIVLIVETDKKHYKLQLELVLVYLLTSLAPLADLPRDINVDKMFYEGVPSRPRFVKSPPEIATPSRDGQDSGRSTPFSTSAFKTPELREIMVEAVARLVHSRDFFPTLFASYDCDIQQTDLCEDLIGFLCRNAYPDSATWSTASVPPLCLESVLSLLESLTFRLPQFKTASSDADAVALVKSLVESKDRKSLEILAAEQFNESPKKGIKAAIEKGIIKDSSPESVAHFLRISRRLNKTVLGRFIAKKDNATILQKFIEQFDFSNKRIDEALREFLAIFRLPGESGEIEPIFEKFSEQYVQGEGNTKVVANTDAAFVLCYSIIMLNTDQHSPQVKNRMPFESFKMNLRGTNNREDFPEEFLKDIYLTIKNREIVLPDEHDNDESFEFAWKDLVLQLPQASESFDTVPAVLDAHVFASVWKPILSTLSFIFATATDDLVFSRVITGFHQAATLAYHYGTEGAVDHITEYLSKISTLSSGDLASPSQNIQIKISPNSDSEKEHSVVVSDLSVPFGSDLKAQMASITLFRIAKSDAIHGLTSAGWEVIAKALTNLYLYDLLAPPTGVQRIPYFYTFERSKAGKNVGIFSALSSYLTSSPDTPAEPSDEDVDAALGAQDCIKACGVAELLDIIAQKNLGEAVDGILATVPNSHDGERYYAAIYYLLELSLLAAGSDKQLNSQAARFAARFDATNATLEFQGRLTNVLLKAHSRAPTEDSDILEAAVTRSSAAKFFLPRLLEFDGSNKQVWDVLSKVELPKSQPGSEARKGAKPVKSKEFRREDLHQLVVQTYDYCSTNATKAPASSLEQVLVSFTKVIEAGYVPALDDLYAIQEKFKSKDEFTLFLQTIILPCLVSDSKIREKGLDKLQKVVQTPDIATSHGLEWQDLFTLCLIPLMEQLLKQDVYKRDPRGMDVTRQRAASILCKTFLQYGVQDDTEIETVWKQLLHVLDRLLSSRQQAALAESISEMLKNVILVLRLSYKGTPEFWQVTIRTLRGFLPDLAELVKQQNELSAKQSSEEKTETEVAEKEAAVAQAEAAVASVGQTEAEGETSPEPKPDAETSSVD